MEEKLFRGVGNPRAFGENAVRLELETTPREFKVNGVLVRNQGKIFLEVDEMVTFATGSGAEFDFTRKSWGFYATPSLNGRLVDFGLRSALVRNTRTGKYYVLVVERGNEPLFADYLEQEGAKVVHWLDTTDALDALTKKIGKARR